MKKPMLVFHRGASTGRTIQGLVSLAIIVGMGVFIWTNYQDRLHQMFGQKPADEPAAAPTDQVGGLPLWTTRSSGATYTTVDRIRSDDAAGEGPAGELITQFITTADSAKHQQLMAQILALRPLPPGAGTKLVAALSQNISAADDWHAEVRSDGALILAMLEPDPGRTREQMRVAISMESPDDGDTDFDKRVQLQKMRVFNYLGALGTASHGVLSLSSEVSAAMDAGLAKYSAGAGDLVPHVILVMGDSQAGARVGIDPQTAQGATSATLAIGTMVVLEGDLKMSVGTVPAGMVLVRDHRGWAPYTQGDALKRLKGVLGLTESLRAGYDKRAVAAWGAAAMGPAAQGVGALLNNLASEKELGPSVKAAMAAVATPATP